MLTKLRSYDQLLNELPELSYRGVVAGNMPLQATKRTCGKAKGRCIGESAIARNFQEISAPLQMRK